MLNARIVALLSLTSLLGLAACGGGGGGNTPGLPTQSVPSPTPSAGATPTPIPTTPATPPTGGQTAPPVTPPPSTPTPTPTNVPAVETRSGQQAQAQNALYALNGLGTVSGPGGLGTLQSTWSPVVLSVRRQALSSGARYGTTPCNSNRQVLTVSPGANGATVYVLQGFGDASCSFKEYEFDAALVAYGSGKVQTVAGSGEQTYYDATGAPAGVASLDTIYVTGLQEGAITTILRGTFSANGGKLTSAFGVECQYGISAVACGNGTIVNSGTLNTSFGSILTLNNSSAASLTGASLSMSAYVATCGGLTLKGLTQTPYWEIDGGSPATAVPKFTPTSTGYTVLDSANDAQVTITLSGAGVSGVIVQASTGHQVAKFNADAYGNGTVTYGDGGAGQIINFMVI